MVSIVVPVFNQLTYTRQFIESVRRSDAREARIIVVDNGSTDDTRAYLAGRTDVTVISNAENRGCAVAWNQGVAAADSDWVLISNNDIVVPLYWLGGLVDFACEHDLSIVSPALREGELNYDFESYASSYVARMRGCARIGIADGICFMVRQDAIARIGPFDEQFRIGQYEDADFFRRARMAGIRMGTTGRSFIHHFSRVTQKAVQKSSPATSYALANRAHYRKKWKLYWYKRLLTRWHMGLKFWWWRLLERLTSGHTLKEKWLEGRLRYF